MSLRCLVPSLLLSGLMIWSAGWGQPTPPVMPKIQEVELPPPVELPAPETPDTAAPTAPITAADAAAIALHNQPSVAVATAGVNAAQGRTQAVRSGLKPQATLSAGLNATHTDGSGAGGPSDFQASATLSKLVYDYNHTRDLVRQALAQEDVAKANLTTVQADLVLRVKLNFYGFVQAMGLVKVAESNVRNQQQHLQLAQARLKSGLGLPYDVVRAQTAYSDAVYGLTVARNGASQARVALAQLLGLDPRTPLTPASGAEASPPPQTVQQLVDEAVQHRPEMVQAEAAIVAARYALAAARTVNSPVVTGSLGVSRRGDVILPENGLITIGVGVQWNALDGGFTKGQVQVTQANLDAATAQQEAIRLQVVSDVSQAYLDLQTAEQGAVTAQAEVTNATEALRLAEGRYRAGLGVFIDVLDAQAALDAASINEVNARSATEQARAALERAVGRNLPQ